jgi:hypothetical protein
LLKVIVSGDVGEAAEAMRHHIQSSLANTLARLEPYFQMREKYADTFSRTPSKQLPLQSPAAGTALVGRG